MFENYYKGKGVVVTGGFGTCGSNLTAKLVELGAKVTVIDDKSAFTNDKYLLLQCEPDTIIEESIINVKKPFRDADIIFHLAAYFANQRSTEHPMDDLRVNGFGTLNVLEQARIGNTKVIYTGSEAGIYGVKDKLPLCAKNQGHPDYLTPYQITKALGENYCKYYSQFIPVVIVRYFNVYGPGELSGQYRGVVARFMADAIKGEYLTVTGGGKETRDFVYVDDAVNGTLLAGTHDKFDTFNIATDIETSINDLAEMVNKIAGNKEGIAHIKQRSWDETIKRRGCYCKLKKMFEFEPAVPLGIGLDRTYNWMKDVLTEFE